MHNYTKNVCFKDHWSVFTVSWPERQKKFWDFWTLNPETEEVCFEDSEFEDFEFELEKDGHWLKQDLVKQKSIDDLQRTITKYKKAAKILNLQWAARVRNFFDYL